MNFDTDLVVVSASSVVNDIAAEIVFVHCQCPSLECLSTPELLYLDLASSFKAINSWHLSQQSLVYCHGQHHQKFVACHWMAETLVCCCCCLVQDGSQKGGETGGLSLLSARRVGLAVGSLSFATFLFLS